MKIHEVILLNSTKHMLGCELRVFLFISLFLIHRHSLFYDIYILFAFCSLCPAHERETFA